jgi:hypothetical protein
LVTLATAVFPESTLFVDQVKRVVSWSNLGKTDDILSLTKVERTHWDRHPTGWTSGDPGKN